MGIIQNILKTFFGDKSSKDIKKMMPTVEKIKAEYAKLAGISNDVDLNLSFRDYSQAEQ